MKFAICDDEKAIRSTLARNIRILYPNADIVCFENGQELLSYADSPDILFLDIQMDGMNGIEAARALRKANSNVTIIFVTAVEESQSKRGR